MSDDFDRYRAQVEEALRADIELLIEGARAKVRAYETVLRVRGELDERPRPALAAEVVVPAAGILRLSSPASPAGGAAPAPAPAARARSPRRPRLSRKYDLAAAVLAVLDQLGETFERTDILPLLPVQPSRASLYRALETLEDRGLVIEVEPAGGRLPARYSKAPPRPAAT